MIEDDELRELFRIESEEHLQMLDDGLLRLETDPHDKPTLEEVFRAAHSLKGTARMLGVAGVETIAHQMEEELGGVRRGRATLDSAQIDRYSVGLAAMRSFVAEAIDGTRATVDLPRVLSQLNGEIPLDSSAPTLPTAPQSTLSADLEAPADFLAPQSTLSAADAIALPISPLQSTLEPLLVAVAPDLSSLDALESDISSGIGEQMVRVEEESAPLVPLEIETASHEIEVVSDHEAAIALVPSEAIERAGPHDEIQIPEFKIQTMRVPPAKLDALLTLASEMTVTTTRVMRGLAAFEELDTLWEEWNKDVSAQRFATLEGGEGVEIARQWHAFGAREQARLARLQRLWQHLKQTAYQDMTRLHMVADELEEGIRNVRLLPLSQIFTLFPRLVRDLARELGKEIYFSVEGGETAADKRILEEIKDPLMHMLRNAIDHGIEMPAQREQSGKSRVASIHLRASQTANNVLIELQDDGRGLDIAAIKRTALKRRLHRSEELDAMSDEQLQMLIFSPGFSTSAMVTDVSGRGVGMDVVLTNIERLKGSIRVRSQSGSGTLFTIRLPSTLSTTRVLIVTVADRSYAIPVEWVQTVMRASREQIFSIEGRPTLFFENRALPIARLSALLELPSDAASANDSEIYVVLEVGDERFGVQVDGLVDEQEVMLKPMGALLKRVRNVSGVTILGEGEICLVLNANDLAKAARRGASHNAPFLALPEIGDDAARKTILLAEDSIATRTHEKRILEGAGYDVTTAVDGAEAFQKLSQRDYDMVISDVEMPNMDGLTLTSRIRENPRYNEMPVVLVTSLSSDEDKKRGVEVGANAYITKGAFEQKALIDTVRRLI